MPVRKPLSMLCGLLIACSASVSADVKICFSHFYSMLSWKKKRKKENHKKRKKEENCSQKYVQIQSLGTLVIFIKLF